MVCAVLEQYQIEVVKSSDLKKSKTCITRLCS